MVLGPLFLFGGYLYKKKYMNFLSQIGNASSQQSLVISANTWSSCLAYLEGTGSNISSIQQLTQQEIYYNVAGTNCFQVLALNSEGGHFQAFVWETSVDTLLTWLNSQGVQSITSIQQANKTYVVV